MFKGTSSADTSLVLSSSSWPKEGQFGLCVQTKDLLFLAEAMLFYYFKPEFNEQYVNHMPNTTHVIYTKLQEAGVTHVQVHLNLFMQTYREILSLRSQAVDTDKAKHLTLYAAVQDLAKRPKDDIISADVLPEELYPILIGDSYPEHGR